MAFKQYSFEGMDVSIYKRKGASSIRLSVVSGNKVRVTIPYWVTYQVGLKFVKTKADWIQSQIVPLYILKSGDRIGKYHKLEMAPHSGHLKSRVTDMEVRISYPLGLDSSSDKVQEIAQKACLRALKAEATKLLPPRLKDLATKHGFSYKDVTIKRMKGRWGSCDSHKNIVLNQYLMQLPWELIDYVLLHELTHTKLMKHGPEFWAAMAEIYPSTPACRKAIKEHKPALKPQS